ncbi:T9SS C-terminal target domain-containing protein [candidate division KSB1 bacterium]|nr:family 10 glycosylhydrolase [candidate division KSB1 bacterium]RQW07326.1 MAG: T9SS C-terminal target domain-containing protein [candidate division KSB1 bacterium]
MKVVFLSLLLIFLFADISSQTPELRGVWITNVDSRVLETDDSIVEAMDYLGSIGINVIFPVVYNKGYTLYPSEVFEGHFGVKTIQQTPFMKRDFLERVIIEAHRNGIEVIPWFEFGFSTSYSQNGGHILQKYPHWALKDNSSNLVVKNGFDWMSGIHPEVQAYMNSLILEVLKKYDIDGIQGDDRLPAMPVEGGYEAYTTELYKAEHDGTEPPASTSNASWKKWRADKLTEYLSALRDSIKSRDENLILSSSPTPFYWGYDAYLQDSKTWAQEGLIDNLIPQLYQKNISDFKYALTAIGTVKNQNPEIFFSGLLAKLGSYVVSQELLAEMIDENRKKNISGECFFFYEALRANNNELGDFLKSTYYAQEALLPYRKGWHYRPKADIANETDADVVGTGTWEEDPAPGFAGNVLRTNETNSYCSLEYVLYAPEKAYYDVYIYMVPNALWADSAHYEIFSDSLIYNGENSISIYYDQSNTAAKGWQKIGTTFLNQGEKRVLKIDNKILKEGHYLFADAAMLMVNRKIKVERPTWVSEKNYVTRPSEVKLYQNFPNPFNPTTMIKYSISAKHVNRALPVQLKVYDTRGHEVAELVNAQQSPGEYYVAFNGEGLASGVYLYRLDVGSQILSGKMLLIK